VAVWGRRFPFGDVLAALAVLGLLVSGMLLLPVPRAVDWPGRMTVAIDGGLPAAVGHGPLMLAPDSGAVLQLTTETDWPSGDIPVLALRNLGGRVASVDVDNRWIGRVGPEVGQGTARFLSRTGYFRLAPSLPAGTQIEVRIDPGPPATIYPELLSMAGALTEAFGRARFVTSIIAILLTMSAASLLLYAATRHRVAAIFSFYTVAQACYVAVSTSEFFEWPGFAALRSYANAGAMLSIAVAAGGVALFVHEMMRDQPQMGLALRPIAWFPWAFALVAVGGLAGLALPALQPPTAVVGNVVMMVWSIYFMLTMVIAARRGSRPAMLMTLGWGMMWFATVARAWSFLTGSYSPVLDYLFPAGVALASVSMALSIAEQWRRQRLELQTARHAAETDGLTGVLNRRAIEARLQAACSDAARLHQDLAILFIDLDHFKAINDRHGHAAGDVCLQRAVLPIRAELRAGDGLGRWGGEEFVVLLPGADIVSARAVAERIRQRVADLEIPVPGGWLRLTASIGIATPGQGGTDADALLRAADAAVYRAKANGRNRVETALLHSHADALRDQVR
jgi:diguanylate cyclase (GGDEF)-like protein